MISIIQIARSEDRHHWRRFQRRTRRAQYARVAANAVFLVAVAMVIGNGVWDAVAGVADGLLW